jgi:phosphoglycolate phosphatase
MTVLRGIIFDKDGTLFDFSTTWEAWAAAFLRRIADTDQHAQALGRLIGFDFDHQRFDSDSVVIAGTPDEVAKALVPGLSSYSYVEIVNVINAEAVKAPQSEVVPLKSFVNGLRQSGYLLGVVTNDAERPARAHLDAAGATELFDFVAGSDSGFGAKPEPGQLLAFAEATGLAPGEVLMVGDSTHDLVAAQRAGMRAVGVLTGLATAQSLAPFAETVLTDIGSLPEWLEAQNRA